MRADAMTQELTRLHDDGGRHLDVVGMLLPRGEHPLMPGVTAVEQGVDRAGVSEDARRPASAPGPPAAPRRVPRCR